MSEPTLPPDYSQQLNDIYQAGSDPGTIPLDSSDVDPYGLGAWGNMEVYVPPGDVPGRRPSQVQAPKAIQQELDSGNLRVGQSPRRINQLFSQQDQGATYTANEFLQRLISAYQAGGLTPKQLQDLQERLLQAGFYKNTGVRSASDLHPGVWDDATTQAIAAWLQANAQRRAQGFDEDIYQTLQRLTTQNLAGGGSTQRYTQKSTSYDLSDPETAKAILSNVLQAYTGVGVPTPEQAQAFREALNAFERQHPSVTTETVTANQQTGETSSTSTSEGGVSEEGRTQFGLDWLRQHYGTDIATYRAATAYYDAALQALEAPVQLHGNG
ncbi:MAG: hypothetical protein IRZ06_10165 [Nevskia sp.]|nr:hypothetical protein [Nevskia sp.]